MPTDDSPRTRQSDLVERTAGQIREMIIDGRLTPGQQLHEPALSGTLQVSRNSLREAFRVLIHEALVERQPHRGVFVRVPDLASVLDIYRVRRMIEGQAALLSVPRHPALGTIRAAVDAALTHRENDKWRLVGSMNMAFHTGLVALADSDRLDELFARLSAELRLAFATISDAEYLHAPYVDANAEILELLEAGRASDAAAALDHYFDRSERTVVAAYRRR